MTKYDASNRKSVSTMAGEQTNNGKAHKFISIEFLFGLCFKKQNNSNNTIYKISFLEKKQK